MRHILAFFTSFFCSLTLFSQANSGEPVGNTWPYIQEKGGGTLVIYWYTSTPFIFRDANGHLTGIEYDLMEGFKKYLHDVYHIPLQIAWKEGPSFMGTYALIRDEAQDGTMAASVFSITPERQQEVAFTPPYMTDITVLISSYDVPIVKDIGEFKHVFSTLTAITIEGTTYEKDLLHLKNERGVDFPIQYIPSSENLLRHLEKRENAFAFLDLPVYLMEFNRNTAVRVKRQNLFPIKRNGYALIYPKGSSWQTPLNAYFESDVFKENITQIIGHYLDQDVYQFLEKQYTNSVDKEIALLTKEKEIQNRDLIGKSEKIKWEARLRKLLVITVIIILLFLILIYRLYYIRSNATLLLSKQKEQIEAQRQVIESKKIELEKRNRTLTELNEEKNDLIKILAHDLRVPINQINGLTQIIRLENDTLSSNQEYLINEISDAASRLNIMISKILDVDAIEAKRTNVNLELINLCEHVYKVVNSFKKQAEQKAIALALSDATAPLFTLCDKLYLTQILENLLSNAIKFSPKEKTVHITCHDHLTHVEIHITDEGPGFTAEDQQNLFKKYQRLSAQPTANEKSTGLGLSIVKKYIELMNGEVFCESQPGKTTFRLKFKKEADNT